MSQGPWKSRPTKKSLPGWQAFTAHQRNARRRGIPFLFDYETWWAWWQVDNRWADRGMGRDKLVMARNEDAGPYSPENVYCTTHGGNQADVPAEARQEARDQAARTAAARGNYGTPWQGIRAGHPMSRPVLTPLGRFPSAALAAEAHGYHPGSASKKARNQHGGWAYE